MQMLPMILPSGAVLAHSLVIKVVNENPDFFDSFLQISVQSMHVIWKTMKNGTLLVNFF